MLNKEPSDVMEEVEAIWEVLQMSEVIIGDGPSLLSPGHEWLRESKASHHILSSQKVGFHGNTVAQMENNQ